jgi:hypothetical protein
MRVTRLVAIADGESRFTEFDIPFESKKLLEFTRIGKTKGIFVRVPRKRAPRSDFHAVLDLFVSETSLIASYHEHHR